MAIKRILELKHCIHTLKKRMNRKSATVELRKKGAFL